jgi:hypothetical protein
MDMWEPGFRPLSVPYCPLQEWGLVLGGLTEDIVKQSFPSVLYSVCIGDGVGRFVLMVMVVERGCLLLERLTNKNPGV